LKSSNQCDEILPVRLEGFLIGLNREKIGAVNRKLAWPTQNRQHQPGTENLELPAFNLELET